MNKRVALALDDAPDWREYLPGSIEPRMPASRQPSMFMRTIRELNMRLSRPRAKPDEGTASRSGDERWPGQKLDNAVGKAGGWYTYRFVCPTTIIGIASPDGAACAA